MDSRSLAAISWLTLAVGVVLIVTPWLFGFPVGIASTDAMIVGAIVAIASLLALMVHDRWEAWPNLVLFNLVLGAWVFISPLLFHYNTDDAATWIHMVGGTAIGVLATIQMWRIAGQGSRPTTVV